MSALRLDVASSVSLAMDATRLLGAGLFGKPSTGWQAPPMDEAAARTLRVCQLMKSDSSRFVPLRVEKFAGGETSLLVCVHGVIRDDFEERRAAYSVRWALGAAPSVINLDIEIKEKAHAG